MSKQRIQIEIKPCCNNCLMQYFESIDHQPCDLQRTNPCFHWKPNLDWFDRQLEMAERKMNKVAKASKKPKQRSGDEEDE